MFSDHSTIRIDTSSDAIFLINKEIDVAIVQIATPVDRPYLKLTDEVAMIPGDSLSVLGFCQEELDLQLVNENQVTRMDEHHVYYSQGMGSGMTGAPAIKLSKQGLRLVGVHDSYSTDDTCPSMATTCGAICNWLENIRDTLPHVQQQVIMSMTLRTDNDIVSADESDCSQPTLSYNSDKIIGE